MSGDGVLSVRLPLSLLGAFRASATRQGISIHEAATRVVSFLPSLSQDDLKALTEPPRELETPKVSLYIGWRGIDVLASVVRGGTLSNSQILRRILFGLLITKTVSFVQQNQQWKLQTKIKKDDQNSSS
jgi:hypothetical protein